MPVPYKVGIYGVPTPDTGVGEHIMNICRWLPDSFEAYIVSNSLLRRRETWAFEPIPTLLFAMSGGKYHLIHSHNEVAWLQRMKTGVRTVTTVHLHPQRVMEEYLLEVSLRHISFNPLYLSKLLINRAQWSRILKVSERVIVTCREHISLLSRLHDIPAERFRYIPNGVDVAAFAPQAKENEPRGLFVGEWSWRKGVHYLLEALQIASNELPDLRLSIVSSGCPDNLKPLDRKIADSVKVYRYLTKSQLIDLYRTASFLILPSLAEASPLAVLESMSCGTPVIAFPTDGIKQVISSNSNGILVPMRDIEGLGRSIIRLGGDLNYARRLGTRARETALAYDWSRIAASTAEVYREVMEGVS